MSGLNLHESPEIVQKAMASKEAAGPIPIMATFDAKITKQLGVVPYYAMKDVDGFKKVKLAVADHLGISLETPKITYQKEKWQDNRGRSIEATYVTSTTTSVTLRLANGKVSTLQLSRLSDASKKRVAVLSKAVSKG